MLNWTEFKNYDTSLYHVLEKISSQQKKKKKNQELTQASWQFKNGSASVSYQNKKKKAS
jgi:hypothetical protein